MDLGDTSTSRSIDSTKSLPNFVYIVKVTIEPHNTKTKATSSKKESSSKVFAFFMVKKTTRGVFVTPDKYEVTIQGLKTWIQDRKPHGFLSAPLLQP